MSKMGKRDKGDRGELIAQCCGFIDKQVSKNWNDGDPDSGMVWQKLKKQKLCCWSHESYHEILKRSLDYYSVDKG